MSVQKQILICMLLTHLVNAGVAPAIIDKTKTTNGTTYSAPSSRVVQPATAIDSSYNGYTLWTQMQECIGYNPIVDAIQIVNKSFTDPGILNVHQTPGNLAYWVHDYSVYKKWWGMASYPNSIASDNGTGNGPHISFRISGPYGQIGFAMYEMGGWFSSLWDTVFIEPPSGVNGTVMYIGKQLPNGNLLFIGTTDTNIYWRTMSPDLSNVYAQGIIANNAYFWGFDINGGIGYILYYDVNLNIYHKTTTDGITWSDQQTYNMVWPNPYSQNILFWTQMAVTDGGDPILVFDIIDGNDFTYPWYGKVYVSYTSGQPCVEVSSTFGAPDTECFYPTIAIGGNKVVVLYCTPRNNEADSLNWWDFFVNWSTDNGQTWGTPINCTQSLTNRPGLPQLAKRIDTLRNRVYYVYGVDMIRDIDPLWHLMFSTGLDPMYICFDYANYVGIDEGEKLKGKGEGLSLMVLPSVVRRDNAQIQYAIPERQRIRLDLYDVLGRKVKTIKEGIVDAGVYSYRLNSSNLISGVYYIILQGERESKRGKILIVK
ncbi:MAG: hypothetical protein ABIL86_06995 [candidate division WOR-3 bacterium]